LIHACVKRIGGISFSLSKGAFDGRFIIHLDSFVANKKITFPKM
jgi:hypothetical protein